MFADEKPDKPFPPTMIHIGDSERVRDESIVFQGRLHRSPVFLEMYQDANHVFQMFSMFDSFAVLSLQRMGDFADIIFSGRSWEAHSAIWIRRTRNLIPLTKSLEIVKHSRRVSQQLGFWNEQRESVFQGIIQPAIDRQTWDDPIPGKKSSQTSHPKSQMSFSEWFGTTERIS
jgi:hypothetical protein